jgi:hypothetical protein
VKSHYHKRKEEKAGACQMGGILPLPNLPVFPKFSPWLVRILDEIRYELCEIDDEKFAEFYCFAGDYPRIYRYHLDHAEHRLKQIYQKYHETHIVRTTELKNGTPTYTYHSVSDLKSFEIFVTLSRTYLLSIVLSIFLRESLGLHTQLRCRSHLTGCA